MESFNVFIYQDYRDLLKDLIQFRRRNNRVFSYRWFSRKAGLTSPNFLNLVVKKKRHLSTDSIESVISIFKFTNEEGHFFRALVGFNKAKVLSEKEHYASQLVKFKKFLNEFPLSKIQFEYYSNWYNIPIRELLLLRAPPRSEEEITLQLQPSVSKQEVESSIKTLLSLDLIKKTPDGWKTTKESITTGHRFSDYGVIQYHKKMLRIAEESLDRFPGSEREISSVTIGLSEKSFQLIKKEIVDFRTKLMEIAEADENKERIYQINFQLFPLSRGGGSRNE